MTGEALADFAVSKLGTPYVYGTKGADGPFTKARLNQLTTAYKEVFSLSYRAKAKKFIGKVCCDCSGLISWFTGKVLGSAQLYQKAYVRMPIARIEDFAIGTILWKKGHVGVYIGIQGAVPMCVEAKGIDYGCIKSKVSDTKWINGLTFPWLTYKYQNKIAGTWKGKNPYEEPMATIKYIKTKTNVVRQEVIWLQWELIEAGYDITMDGKFGKKTLAALKAFQQTCDINVDGICGNITKKYLA